MMGIVAEVPVEAHASYLFNPRVRQKGKAINGKCGVSVKSIKVGKLVKACRDSVFGRTSSEITSGRFVRFCK